MPLLKLTKDNIADIAGRRICCVGVRRDCLDEMSGTFAGVLINNIRLSVSSSSRRDVLDFGGKRIPLYGYAHLDDIDTGDYEFLITDEYYNEAYEILAEKECLKDRNIYFFAGRNTEFYLGYKERFKNTPLKNIIVFRSGPAANSYVHGMDFSDNARALFEYMLKNGYSLKYELVWLVKYPEEYKKYGGVKNVKFISFDWAESDDEEQRDIYYHYLCLAKYIFFTDAYGFAREARSDQTRVQLWHGCGFKTRVYFGRCEKRYEYTTVISGLYSEIHRKIYGLREDQMLVTGYAKNDWLFEEPSEDFFGILGIPKGRNKYIFWLPTFRTASVGELGFLNEFSEETETGLPVIHSETQIKKLNEILAERNAELVIKLHPFQDKSSVNIKKMSNIILADNDVLFDNDIQTNQLLYCADALISDYSSAAVDFLMKDRPMAFTLEDVEEYSSNRGFVFDNIKEWLPGKEIWDFGDFCDFICMVSDGKDGDAEKRHRLRGKMHSFDDGGSCGRIIEALGI